MKTPLSCALMVPLILTQVASLSAQDRFGSAVAVAGPNVVVLKPSNSRGPATVYLFGLDESGKWVARDRFYPEAASETGEGFGPELKAMIIAQSPNSPDDTATSSTGTVFEITLVRWASSNFCMGLAPIT